MKAIQRVLFILGLICGIVLLTFFVANLSDETLNLEAAEILRESPITTESGVRAFYYLLGLRIGESKDPQRQGQELWNVALSAPLDQEGEILNKRMTAEVWPYTGFVPRFDQPVSRQWSADQKWRLELEKANEALNHYIQLLKFGEYTPLKPRRPFSMGTSAPWLLRGHRLLIGHLAGLVAQGKWTDAQKLLQMENHFQEKLFVHGYLLDATVAQLILHENARFFEAEVKANPKLRVSQRTKDSFQFPEPRPLMTSALRNELRHFAWATQTIPIAELISLTYGDANRLKYLPLNGLLMPNETINQYMLFLNETLSIRCPEEGNACYASVQWASPANPIAWFRNPAGRGLFRIYASGMDQRMTKIERRDRDIRTLLRQL